MVQTYDMNSIILFTFGILNMLAALVAGVLVWRSRREVSDRSRIFLALSLFLCTLVFMQKSLRLIVHPQSALLTEAMPPAVVFTAVFPQLLMLFYPVEIIKPGWLNWMSLELILLPYVLMTMPALLVAPNFFVHLHSFADLLQHLMESNVLWRLLILLLIAGNALVLLLVPINYRRSSADHRWVLTYVGVFTLIGILLCGWLLTRSFLLQVAHNLAALFYTIYFTWFELSERVYPRQYK